MVPRAYELFRRFELDDISRRLGALEMNPLIRSSFVGSYRGLDFRAVRLALDNGNRPLSPRNAFGDIILGKGTKAENVILARGVAEMLDGLGGNLRAIIMEFS